MKVSLQQLLIVCCLAAFTTTICAEPWKFDLNANLTTAINSYSDNWSGGEAGSFTWAAQFQGVAVRQATSHINTKTTLKLQFGQTATQDKTSKNWSMPQKSSDLIDGEELLRFTLGCWVDPFVSVRGISQFLDKSDTALVRYGNPLDLTEAVGASRTLIKNEDIEWAARLGFAARQLFNRQHLDTALGVREMDITNDGGVELNVDFKAINKEKWISFLSSLRLYEALLSSKAEAALGTATENHWRYPHLKWENTLTLTLAKYLMLNVSAYEYFDKDVANDIRLKETFSAGLTYTFSTK